MSLTVSQSLGLIRITLYLASSQAQQSGIGTVVSSQTRMVSRPSSAYQTLSFACTRALNRMMFSIISTVL